MPNPETTFIAVLPGHVTTDYTGGYVMEARGEEIPTDPEAWELVMRSFTRGQLMDTEKLVYIDDARFEVFEVLPMYPDEARNFEQDRGSVMPGGADVGIVPENLKELPK